jgi:hypothetical protein
LKYRLFTDSAGRASCALTYAGGEFIALSADGTLEPRRTRFCLGSDDAEVIMEAEGTQTAGSADDDDDEGDEVYWVGTSSFTFKGNKCFIILSPYGF